MYNGSWALVRLWARHIKCRIQYPYTPEPAVSDLGHFYVRNDENVAEFIKSPVVTLL